MRALWECVSLPVALALLAGCSSTSSLPTAAPPAGSSAPPLIIAHRGARSLAPENTLAAARKALEAGADMWEMDVAVTADGELIVVHDDTLERTSNVAEVYPDRRPWQVWDFTLAEIQALDFGSWFEQRDPFGQIKAGNVSAEDVASYAGERAPTLRQALEFTRDNDWRINVELKEQPTDALGQILVDETVALVQELGMDAGDRVFISSFNHDYLRGVRALNPRIPIQALTSNQIDNLSEYLSGLGTRACNPKSGAWSPRELQALGQEGIQMNVWTVNDQGEMEQLVAANVHGIITDFPQILVRLLEQRPG
ncbi:MAG TPA: glycerophosphodiester phosphodiesterase family protein [Anaerolineae bacterium]|nr:glycerophosphodiester phosphodiesterase family protein [Anaerolineae bacterium]